MSSVGFDVHVDKENVTYAPGINKGGPLKQFGPRKFSKGNVQATPRKALVDVNHEPVNVTASRNPVKNKLSLSSTDLKDGCFSALKPSLLIPSGAENVHVVGSHNKKQDSRKFASGQKKEVKILKDAELHSPPIKCTVTVKKPKPEQKSEQEVAADEEYESDSIFPRSERLSSYVEKLLTWRFPCLLRPSPDSESESSDLEDLLQHNDIFLDESEFLSLVPEFSDTDLDNLMEDFPPPKPDFKDHDKIVCQDKSLE